MNINPRYILIPLLLSTLLITACGLRVIQGSGDIVKEDRDVSGFDRVEFSGFGRVLVTQGNQEFLTIEVDDNLLQYIDSDVVGDTLKIDFDDNIVPRPTDNTIIFELGVIDLSSIAISGAGSFEIDELKADELDVTMSGAGKIDIDEIEATELSVVVTGAGNVNISGTVEKQEIRIGGVGDFNALDLESQETTVNISGAGDADVWAHDVLDINISGAGSVSYYGDPEISQSVSGLGSINSRGER
jgi:hypothetical protein